MVPLRNGVILELSIGLSCSLQLCRGNSQVILDKGRSIFLSSYTDSISAIMVLFMGLSMVVAEETS